LRELIRDGENGLLCDPYDLPAGLRRPAACSTIRSFARDPVLRRPRDRGRAYAARHAARIAAIYHGLPSRMGEAA
jgi:hypothetical protein